MLSQLAIEDLEALIEEGCVVHPSDAVRLCSLGLKLEKKPDFRFSNLPRVAMCGNVRFSQPTIEQDIFLDNILQMFSKDEGTTIALEAYVLAHPEKDWSKSKVFPRVFAAKCAMWVKKHLGKETAAKVRAALDFVKYGMNPMDGEHPVYVKDEEFDKWYFETGPKSYALRQYTEACACGIAPYAALKATSPRLAAMIERAWLLNERDISEDEKQTSAEYFATLSEIQEKARKERDAKTKKSETSSEPETSSEVISNG